jgi:hypothetical protein
MLAQIQRQSEESPSRDRNFGYCLRGAIAAPRPRVHSPVGCDAEAQAHSANRSNLGRVHPLAAIVSHPLRVVREFYEASFEPVNFVCLAGAARQPHQYGTFACFGAIVLSGELREELPPSRNSAISSKADSGLNHFAAYLNS